MRFGWEVRAGSGRDGALLYYDPGYFRLDCRTGVVVVENVVGFAFV